MMQLTIVEALIGIIGSLIVFFLGLIFATQKKHGSSLGTILDFISAQRVTNTTRDGQIDEIKDDMSIITDKVDGIDKRLVKVETNCINFHKANA